jgi:hypothetical protein
VHMTARQPRRSMNLFASSIAIIILTTWAVTARAEGRFGDSTWVAPGHSPHSEPSASGPRVAEPDHERTWETVLRAPFRVAFLPVRLFARGLEASANVVEHVVPPGSFGKQGTVEPPGIRVSPAFSYSGAAGPGLGASVTSAHFAGPGTRFSATGTWSLKDNRRLRIRTLFGEGVRPIGTGIDLQYDYRPNRRFYGMGNDAPHLRTIYLRREDTAEGWVFFGKSPERRVRALIGLSDINIGNGYGGAGSPHAADLFSPAEVPFLTEDSRVWYYGAAGELAGIDRVRDPSRGVHVRGEARRARNADDTEVRYDAWRLEGRGYLPVFSSRRVIALRSVLRGVDPESGSDPIPFYRLPESSEQDRFSAYSSGRFRDQRLLILHAEYRWLLWERLWAVALAQRGMVAGSNHALRYADMHESYGGGLRLRISDARTARLEIAKGADGMNVYLDMKGDF